MNEIIENEFSWISQRMKHAFKEFDLDIPSESSVNQSYVKGNTHEWTCGFWVGISWLIYENTNDQFFYEKALALTDVLIDRLDRDINLDHHDIGFLYSLSIVPAYYHTNDSKYLKSIQKAADKLISRFHNNGEFIQCWGTLGDPDEYRLIIDSLLNMPFLFTSSKLLGDPKYANIATKHYNTVFKNIIRDDYTTYHTYYFDVVTGKPKFGKTAQGYSNDSCWSRGQAWAIAGICFNQEYLNNNQDDDFNNLLNVFKNNIPDDGVVYWDFAFNDNNPSAKDTSANSIVACGLLERAKYVDDVRKQEYINMASELVLSVMNNYSNRNLDVDTIVSGCTYSFPQGIGVDEACLWGDYYYLEALTRLSNPEWKKYW
ncbi:glycoside hydrolase family 88 protein [Mollicutes bacterium LVI A0039]|nr:glycoside hydrolase family 88 protein [Mollicutes bacterium LVI A0039]